MDKRYQVFVSSTYKDLIEERHEVIQALLELDCIPAGMELFPAANDDQWTLIKRVIDDCDYYLVIVGGRYGSLGPDGLSYTEMEYLYALETNKPIIGFLHENTGKISSDKTEQTDEGKKKLNNFRDLVQKKLCRFWETPSDLGGKVSRSVIQLIKTHPAIGWGRADKISQGVPAEDVLKLKNRIEQLEEDLALARQQQEISSLNLAKGEELLTLDVTTKFTKAVHAGYSNSYTIQYSRMTTTWNELFAWIAPHLLDEMFDNEFRPVINACLKEMLIKDNGFSTALYSVTISENDYQTIKIQFMALDLIENEKTTWQLTTTGKALMFQLRTIKTQGDVLS